MDVVQMLTCGAKAFAVALKTPQKGTSIPSPNKWLHQLGGSPKSSAPRPTELPGGRVPPPPRTGARGVPEGVGGLAGPERMRTGGEITSFLLPVAMPGAPFVASLLVAVRPGAPSSFLLLVASNLLAMAST